MSKVLNVKMRKSGIQATRTIPAKEIIVWDVETPNGWVACKSLDQAREVAVEYGATILL